MPSHNPPHVPPPARRQPWGSRRARREDRAPARRLARRHLLRGRRRRPLARRLRPRRRDRPGPPRQVVPGPGRRPAGRGPGGLPGAPPGLGLPGRERALRGAGQAARDRLGRAAGARDPPDGRQGDRAPHDGGARAADDPRLRRDPRRRGRGAAARRRDRLPGPAQGDGRRRGPRDARRAGRGPARGRLRRGQPRGAGRLRRRRPLPREVRAERPAHRVPGAGLQLGARGPPGRARVLGPAPAPEAGRGGARARRSTRRRARRWGRASRPR